MSSPEDTAGSGSIHIPVLREAVVSGLDLEADMVLLDGTLGAGGHTEALMTSVAGEATVIALDRDGEIMALARQRLAPYGERIRFFNTPFADMRRALAETEHKKVDRILLDLGISSFALDTPERGFGIMASGPLDMRMDRSCGITAAELLAHIPERELADLIYGYGEDRYSRRIARAIVQARQRGNITTTTHLAEIVARAVPGSSRGRLHPATRTFQALRIEVNREMDQLGEGLEAVAEILAPEGRVAVISFHSLEDRMVKRFFKERMTPLTKKPIRPTPEEIRFNRRSRSARLRIASPATPVAGGMV